MFYCATTPTVMIYKLALLFKKNNYKTILFTNCDKEFIDLNYYKEVFDEIIYSDFKVSKENLSNPIYLTRKIPNLARFFIKLKTIKPYVVIGNAGNNQELKFIYKNFLKKYPFIYFPYDIISHFFSSKENALRSDLSPKIKELEAEKYLFENSDGILHKGGSEELKPLEGRIFKKIKFASLQLNFSPYCSKEFIVSINKDKLSKKDKEIHIVYTGFLANNKESATIFRKYFKEIMDQKIHLHIYSTVNHISKKEETEYVSNFFKDLKEEEYLHLHKPLNPKVLTKEISKYDFSLWLAYETNENNIEAIYSIGNKISTYLEAGLPIIYNENSIFIDKILKYYGLELSFTNENLINIKKRLEKLNYEKMIKNLEKAREDFNMDKNFPRLEEFIKKVVAKNK